MHSFDSNQKVSSSLALILIMIMSFAIAWFSLSVGEKIMDDFSQSAIYNPGGNKVK